MCRCYFERLCCEIDLRFGSRFGFHNTALLFCSVFCCQPEIGILGYLWDLSSSSPANYCCTGPNFRVTLLLDGLGAPLMIYRRS